jgi:hypothetical protein
MTPEEGLPCQQIVNLLFCIEMRESCAGTLFRRKLDPHPHAHPQAREYVSPRS